MALGVVEDRCEFSGDMRAGKIVVESAYENTPENFQKAFHELQEGAAARQLAIQYAATQGMASPRINGNVVGPYAVNAEGVPLEEVRGPKNETFMPAHPL